MMEIDGVLVAIDGIENKHSSKKEDFREEKEPHP
jgi:hypothetical protein